MNDGQTNEAVQNQPIGLGNAAYYDTANAINGPLRCGIFSQAQTSREESGASYYGVLELTGNTWERCATIGNSTGRSFQGTHGDGILTTDGYATNTDWPGYHAPTGKILAAGGSDLRGGSWNRPNIINCVSGRDFGAYSTIGRASDFGGRCVRTAP